MTNEELTIKIQNGESDLMNELWEQNQSFFRLKAYKIYNHYRERCIQCGVTEDDIFQVGFLALYEAVQAYKPDEYKVLSYTNYPLKSRINELLGYRGRRELLNECDSLDKPVNDDDESIYMIDSIADPDSEQAYEIIIEAMYNRELRNLFNTVLSGLPKRQELILRKRFYHGMTQKQIADELNVSHQLIGQTERDGLRKLRKASELESFRNEMISNLAYKHTGLRYFRDTHTSSVENAVLEIEKTYTNLKG